MLRFLVLAVLLAPSVSACSFFVNPDGGLDARVHSIRSGQFGFAGTVTYTVDMGDGTTYELGAFEGGATPDAFVHTYPAAGSYDAVLECTFLDDGSTEQYSEHVSVGGAFGLAWWMWLIIVAGVGAIGYRIVRARRGGD